MMNLTEYIRHQCTAFLFFCTMTTFNDHIKIENLMDAIKNLAREFANISSKMERLENGLEIRMSDVIKEVHTQTDKVIVNVSDLDEAKIMKLDDKITSTEVTLASRVVYDMNTMVTDIQIAADPVVKIWRII